MSFARSKAGRKMWLRASGVLSAAGSMSLSVAVWAQSAKPFAAPQDAPPMPATGIGGAAHVTLALFFVLAAVFAAGWLLRRLRAFGPRYTDAIKIVADVALGAKERAVLIQIGREQLLIGVAPGRVSTLHVLAQPIGEHLAGSTPSAGEANVLARPDFKAILRRSLGLS